MFVALYSSVPVYTTKVNTFLFYVLTRAQRATSGEPIPGPKTRGRGLASAHWRTMVARLAGGGSLEPGLVLRPYAEWNIEALEAKARALLCLMCRIRMEENCRCAFGCICWRFPGEDLFLLMMPRSALSPTRSLRALQMCERTRN